MDEARTSGPELGPPREEEPRAPRREDLAYRHADLALCARVKYRVDLTRWRQIRDLSYRAERVLAWYCALHRSGPVGCLGTRAPQQGLADVIAEAIHEPCSRATLDRSQAELVKKGYLLRSYGYDHRSREIAPGEHRRNRVVMYTLTQKARDVWSRRTISSKSSNCERYDLPEDPGFQPGIPARAIDIASPDRDEANDQLRSRSAASPDLAAVPAAAGEPRHPPRPVAPLATLADRREGEPQAVCQLTSRWTSYHGARPKGAPPVSRTAAVDALLETVRAVTYGRGRLEELVVTRATAELRPGAPAESGIDWDYWIARWPIMRRVDRRRIARLELVPRLSPAQRWEVYDPPRRADPVHRPPAPAPDVVHRGGAPPRASPAPPPLARGEPERVEDVELPDWLKEIRRRHCGEEKA